MPVQTRTSRRRRPPEAELRNAWRGCATSSRSFSTKPMVLYWYLIRSEDGARPGEVAGEWRCDATRTLNEVRCRTLWTVLDALRGLRPCTRADKSTIPHKTSERWSVDRSRGFPIVRLGEPVRCTKLRSINPCVLGYTWLCAYRDQQSRGAVSATDRHTKITTAALCPATPSPASPSNRRRTPIHPCLSS
jgi:hypothetical protein